MNKKCIRIKGQTRSNLQNETLRAIKSFMWHIRRGRNVKDALTLMEASYGKAVGYQVLVALKNNI